MQRELNPVIAPIDKKSIKKELKKDNLLIRLEGTGFEGYVIRGHEDSYAMQEIARLREISFRDAGAGTGQPLDWDRYDTGDNQFFQIVVWNPYEEEFVGGYRVKLGKNMGFVNEQPDSPTSHLFKYSNMFIEKFFPFSIELGRSFVAPEYQPLNPKCKNRGKSIYSLDNLMQMLGATLRETQEILGEEDKEKALFIGKVTLYDGKENYGDLVRNVSIFLMEKHYELYRGINPKEEVISDIRSIQDSLDKSSFKDKGLIEQVLYGIGNFKQDFKKLQKFAAKNGIWANHLINRYYSLAERIFYFGSSPNKDFGGTTESGTIIMLGDITQDMKDKYIKSYKKLDSFNRELIN